MFDDDAMDFYKCPKTKRAAFRSLPSDAGGTVSVVGVGVADRGPSALGAAVAERSPG